MLQAATVWASYPEAKYELARLWNQSNPELPASTIARMLSEKFGMHVSTDDVHRKVQSLRSEGMPLVLRSKQTGNPITLPSIGRK